MQSPLEKVIQGPQFKDSDGFYDADASKIKLNFLVAQRLQFISKNCWDQCVRVKGTFPDLHPGELICIDRCVAVHNAVYDVVSQELKAIKQQQTMQPLSSFSTRLQQQQEQRDQ